MQSEMTCVVVAAVEDVLRELPAPPESWLSPSEWVRAQRLRVPSRHRHYLAGHWLARLQLGRLLDRDPARCVLVEREHLPPQVLDAPLQLSLSHSGDWIACALSPAAIGIDLEQRGRGPQLRSFAHLLAADGETAGDLSDDTLLQRWVLKEALIKRDCGSALPDLLAAIRLVPCAAADASVELLSTNSYELAVASPQPWHIEMSKPVLDRQCWLDLR
ncbi:MAG: 4'-phosphopantetheinyl transferase superfamily protein [Lysobacterales bacterium]